MGEQGAMRSSFRGFGVEKREVGSNHSLGAGRDQDAKAVRPDDGYGRSQILDAEMRGSIHGLS